MDIHRSRFSLFQVIFFLLWWSSTLISGFAYWEDITSFKISNACGAGDVGAFIAQAANPRHWFALFTLGLTVYGVIILCKNYASKWPWFADGRWLIGIVALGLVLLITLVGCN